MIRHEFIKPLAGFTLAIFLIGQIAIISVGLFIPQRTEAFLGVGDVSFDTIIGNIYQVVTDIGLGALRQIAIDFANKYLTKLVSKIQEKYKIQNYLYYDQVLTDYYLSNYISDKIQDPDLRAIYGLLNAGFVTGTPTGTTGGPNPNSALIPRLKTAISNYYQKQGGIDPNKIYNPSPNISDREYFATAQAYFSNPPSYTEQNLRGQFGAFQSAATTAAQLEVIVGNGLKAGRIVGGVCSLGSSVNNGPSGFAPEADPPKNIAIRFLNNIGLLGIAQAQNLPSTPLPTIESGGEPPGLPPGQTPQTYIEHQTDTPATCQAQGGTWQPSALDNVRSFIQNPTAFTAGWMDSAIRQITGNKFDPNNYAAVIGSFVGNFLFNQLTITKNDGTLNETPNPYGAQSGNVVTSKGIDIDGDGVIDGYDSNNDGQPDICVYGGIPSQNSQQLTSSAGPPCLGSRAALTINNPSPIAPGGERPPCTIIGFQEQQFMLPLLNAIASDNPVVSPPTQNYQNEVQNVMNQTDAQFGLTTGNSTSYDPSKNVIGLPEWYAAGPTPGRLVSPANGLPWDANPVCPAQ